MTPVVPPPSAPASGPASALASLRAGFAALVDGLVSLAAAPACAGCEAPGEALCGACAGALAGPAFRVPGVAPPGLPPGVGPPPVAACTPYAGVAPRLVNAWKERGRHDLEPALGAALARAVAVLPGALPPAGVVLVPVPSSAAARRRRGADGVRLLAAHAARSLTPGGVPARVLPALRPARAVEDQSGLSAQARALNVAGAFAVAPRMRGHPLLASGVVVVDDVLTTGATLVAASAAVAAGGGVVDGWACVAATPLRRRPRATSV